jgi:hypothetical protein
MNNVCLLVYNEIYFSKKKKKKKKKKKHMFQLTYIIEIY